MPGHTKATSGSNLRTERPVQTAMVWAPKVLSLEGEYLLWDTNRNSINTPGVGLLDGFLSLADAKPDAIFRFARKWGALRIKWKAASELRCLEPIAVWSDLAIRFRALYRIGAELNCERVGAAEDWQALGSQVPTANRSYKALEEARFALMSNMGRLVREACLHPRLYWNKSTGQWEIEFGAYSGTNLFAVLVLKLMVSIADKEGFALCSGCHKAYPPEKQPSVGRRNYCPACRSVGVPFRDSKREQRRRKREGNA
jgi:hypothetical protein